MHTHTFLGMFIQLMLIAVEMYTRFCPEGWGDLSGWSFLGRITFAVVHVTAYFYVLILQYCTMVSVYAFLSLPKIKINKRIASYSDTLIKLYSDTVAHRVYNVVKPTFVIMLIITGGYNPILTFQFATGFDFISNALVLYTSFAFSKSGTRVRF